ncbi:hypothetical protein [uncultured Helicobacter sp.]|nr:hypothetical protein [uncultured Helicobacter sp.]
MSLYVVLLLLIDCHTDFQSARNDESNTEKLTGDKILKSGF